MCPYFKIVSLLFVNICFNLSSYHGHNVMGRGFILLPFPTIFAVTEFGSRIAFYLYAIIVLLVYILTTLACHIIYIYIPFSPCDALWNRNKKSIMYDDSCHILLMMQCRIAIICSFNHPYCCCSLIVVDICSCLTCIEYGQMHRFCSPH